MGAIAVLENCRIYKEVIRVSPFEGLRGHGSCRLHDIGPPILTVPHIGGGEGIERRDSSPGA